jgi:hypothetical protein
MRKHAQPGQVMTSDTTALGAEIVSTADRIRALRGLRPGPADALLPELATLDEAERDLRTVRDMVLAEVRKRGISWRTIEASTGVPATTWRGRLNRFTEEASQS